MKFKKLSRYIIPNNFQNFVKYFFILNSIIFTFIILLEVFLNVNVKAYYNYNDIFGDFLKAADSLHIVKLWNGINHYDLLLEQKAVHHVVPPFTIFIWAVSSYLIKFFFNKYLFYFLIFIFPIFVIFLYKSIKVKYFFILLLSYPILFAIQRGNVAILVFIFTFFSYYFYIKDKIILSLIFLVLATSLKVTPILFIFLLLDFKKFKESFRILFIFLLILFVFNIIIININILIVDINIYDSTNFFKYIKVYNTYAIYNFGGLFYGSSLYMPILTIIKSINNNLYHLFILINPYFFNFLIFAIIFFIKNNLYSIKYYLNNKYLKLEIITICFILFMPVTGDYYLLFLFLPLIFIPFTFFSDIKKLCYLFLLIPKELINTQIIIGIELPIGAFINPILLLIILFDILNSFNSSRSALGYKISNF